jgi:aminoglycoside phosphotransferase family enzyme/predicted kinase
MSEAIPPAATPSWEDIACALAEGRVSGAEGGTVFETHISYVVVGRQRVHKLKKPVVMSYVDYSTPSRRRTMCERELELNRRLAPSLYVGVSGIRWTPAGLEICEADDPDSIEYVVVMLPIDSEASLQRHVDTLRAQPEELRAVGTALARFHERAEQAPAPAGTPERFREWAERRIAAAHAAPDGLLDPGRVTAACEFLDRWIANNAPLLHRRIDDGWVRDGHGDLRMEHVVVTDDGVEVLDCVEFDDALRHNDVLADLSFLVMELQYAGREDLTRALIDAWAAAGGPLDEQLLWTYASSRALVRIEVGLSRVEQLGRQVPTLELRVAEERLQAMLALSVRLSWRARNPTAVLFSGLSGSGKSSISRILASRWGLERVSSDEVRKLLVGVGRNDPAPGHAYDDYVSATVYERLGREAGREVAAGRSVLVDATFRRPADAQRFVRAFRAAGALAQPITLACTAEPAVLRQRVRERAERGGSDAGLDVLEAQLVQASTPGISNTIELPTDASLPAALEAAELLVLDVTVGPRTR